MRGDQRGPLRGSDAEDPGGGRDPAGSPEPLTNLLRVLCAEPFDFRPWEVGRLTPFQVRRVLMAERDQKGLVILDGPLRELPAEVDMAREWRDLFLTTGYTDPDAIRLAAAAAES